MSPNLPIIRTGVIRILAPLLRFRKFVIRASNQWINAATTKGSPTAGADQVTDEEKPYFQRFKDGVTDLFEIPDEAAGWMLPAIWSGARAIRRNNVAAILATGRPWTTLVIGAVLKQLTGRPLVVDFRDPWMTNPFRIPTSTLKNRIEKWLEQWVVRTSDLIVANTEELREEFIVRFGADIAGKCVAILNGYDDEEFSKIRNEAKGRRQTEEFTLLHSGFLYGKRDPKSLIDAIRVLKDRGLLESEKFRCNLIGSVELSYDLGEYIREQGLEAVVRLGGEVSYAQSISMLATCNLALLLQPGTATQIPSKIFECIGLGKRIVTIANPYSSVAKLVIENELGVVLDPADIEGIADAIESEFRSWNAEDMMVSIDPKIMAKFEVKNGIHKLSAHVDRVLEFKEVV